MPGIRVPTTRLLILLTEPTKGSGRYLEKRFKDSEKAKKESNNVTSNVNEK